LDCWHIASDPVHCNIENTITNLVILGGGESGVGTALLGKEKGYDVFVSDKGKIKEKYKQVLLHNEIEWEDEQHTESKILNADIVMKSPGIPDTVPLVKQIHENGIPVVSEIEFASKFTDATIVGITGSNGKTTTATLTHHILKQELNAGLAGNIGDSFAKQIIEEDFENYVLEISSFQLDDIIDFKPHIAVLLNITPDHLDRYDYKFENYIQSKFRIAKNQIRKQTIRESLANFQGVEHRLEQVLKINKVQYVNDSKATNVNATYYALESMDAPTVWIVGGVDKGNNYEELFPFVNEKVKAIICLGVDNQKLMQAFGNMVDVIIETQFMNEAVKIAYKVAESGDNVLLSPACASFDLFENYEDRGRQFKEAVRNL